MWVQKHEYGVWNEASLLPTRPKVVTTALTCLWLVDWHVRLGAREMGCLAGVEASVQAAIELQVSFVLLLRVYSAHRCAVNFASPLIERNAATQFFLIDWILAVYSLVSNVVYSHSKIWYQIISNQMKFSNWPVLDLWACMDCILNQV
jgi:hypothetical protein